MSKKPRRIGLIDLINLKKEKLEKRMSILEERVTYLENWRKGHLERHEKRERK